MSLTTFAPDITTAGSFVQDPGLPGQIVDTSETVIASYINNRKTYQQIGTANITLSSVFVSGGTVSSLTIVLSNYGSTQSAVTSMAAVSTALSSYTGFIAAFNSTFTGVVAALGGAAANRLTLSSAYPFAVGSGTANTILGLTAGSVTATAVAAMEFGVAAVYSPLGDGYCSSPLNDSDKLIGITVRNPFARAQGTDNTIDYKQAEPTPIMRLGDVWTVAAESGSIGDAVVVLTQATNSSVPVAGALGTATGGAGGTVGRIATSGWTWISTPVAGTLGRVRIVQ